MPVIPQTFSHFRPAGVAMLLVPGGIGPKAAGLTARIRSLNSEHVSPEMLVLQEICRRQPSGRMAGNPLRQDAVESGPALPARVLGSFWTRKPDAGILLEGFPATLLHARAFDRPVVCRADSVAASRPAGRWSTSESRQGSGAFDSALPAPDLLR